MSNILNPEFHYINAASTDIKETLKRFGFKPTTDKQRAEAQRRLHGAKPKAAVLSIAGRRNASR